MFVPLAIVLSLLKFSQSKIHGVDPSRLDEYTSSDLKCPTSGLKLTPEMINDGFCDCPEDGFDEPGTAACSKAKFYCTNKPLKPEYIDSFKVNDGVCDCCDGSDEYLNAFGTPCPNTCYDQIKSARREKYIEKAKIKKALKSAVEMKQSAAKKKGDMQLQLSDINIKLDEIKRKAESIPKDIRENPAAFEEFVAEYKIKIKELEDLISLVSVSRQSSDAEGQAELPFENPSWSHMLGDKISRIKDILSSLKGTRQLTTTITQYIPMIVTKTVVKFEPSVSPESRLNELEYEKQELEGQASVLDYGLKYASYYGPDDIYLALKDDCFSWESSPYTYSLCWFKEVTQNSASGHNNLGNWKGWYEHTNGTFDYTKMHYTDGYRCGATPRETTVKLECGMSNEILSVSEPSTCQYLIKFTSPAACTY